MNTTNEGLNPETAGQTNVVGLSSNRRPPGRQRTDRWLGRIRPFLITILLAIVFTIGVVIQVIGVGASDWWKRLDSAVREAGFNR